MSGSFIDHGMGIVIGETAEIEEDVVLFHGVTLGGTGRDTGKRHPTVKKGAMISARAQILGPVVIGERSKLVRVLLLFQTSQQMPQLWVFLRKSFV